MCQHDQKLQAKPNEDTDKAYDAIEINRMRACRLEAPGANLLFCLEPKQALYKKLVTITVLLIIIDIILVMSMDILVCCSMC